MTTKAQDTTASIATLRASLKPGDTVYTIIRHVSRSGMRRRISLYVVNDGKIENITWDAARAMGDSVKQGGQYVQDAGLVVNGCGMDMAFHTVYNLGSTLYPDGFGLPMLSGNVKVAMKITPQTETHAKSLYAKGYRAEGRNGNACGWDNNGGYALNQRAL